MVQILGGPRSTGQFPVCSSRLLPWLSGLIVVLALIPLPAAAQQNILTNASEDQVANLFSSGGPYTPVLSQNSFVDGGGLFSPSNYVSPYGYTVSGCQIIQYDCYDPAGHITSTAYDLGNGLYLYAYRVQSGSCPGYVWIDGFDWDVICLLDAVHLTVPLGGNAPVSAGGVSSGAFWIGTLSPLQADFSTCYGYQSAFTWFNSSEEWGILCEEIASDAVTSATVDNATSPTALTFTFPGINATNCWERVRRRETHPVPKDTLTQSPTRRPFSASFLACPRSLPPGSTRVMLPASRCPRSRWSYPPTPRWSTQARASSQITRTPAALPQRLLLITCLTPWARRVARFKASQLMVCRKCSYASMQAHRGTLTR